MSGLSEKVRKQLKGFIAQTTDEALDLTINVFGKYIDEKLRKKIKKESEREISATMEQTMTKALQIGAKIKEEYEKDKIEALSLKEKFYLMTDEVMRPFVLEVPKNIHVMDSFFEACKEFRDFRFEISYLKEIRYVEYLKAIKKLIDELKRSDRLGVACNLLNDFKDSKDAYTLLQASFQKLIYYYEFLERNFAVIKKEQIDKYLEIYDELSGQYEKCLPLIVSLIEISLTNNAPKYEDVKKRRLFRNITFIQKHRWGMFVSSFNRNIRNAITHRTYKVDLIKGTVDFYDANKTITLTFGDVQMETRELSALLLILPHMLVSVFCSAFLRIKEALDNLPN